MRFVILSLVVALAGCSDHPGQPAQTGSFVISGPEEAKKAITVRAFDVTPEAVKPGEPVTVKVELAEAVPSRPLSIDWHAPDGWVVSHDLIDGSQTRIEETAPAGELDEPGRYRAVLRSGDESLAEDTVTVVD